MQRFFIDHFEILRERLRNVGRISQNYAIYEYFLQILTFVLQGNSQSAEESLPQPTAAPPPNDPYGFEQYKWAYIAGCIFGLVIIAFVINKLCCSSKEEEQLKNDKLAKVSKMIESAIL